MPLHTAQQHLVELLRIDWLGNMIVHPGFKAESAIIIERVGRHRQDGRVDIERIGPDGLCCLNAEYVPDENINSPTESGR